MPATYLTHSIFNASVHPSVDHEGLFLIVIGVNGTFRTDNEEVITTRIVLYEEMYTFDSLSQALEECIEIIRGFTSSIGQN